MKPRVSILLPVYNAESTLRDCLKSLFAQTLGDFEILAVDDGSKDASPDILIEFSRQDSRLRMINIEHGGIVAGLKAGFGHSEARYLARMDADDISLPSRLEKQVALLDERNDVAVVGCQVGPVTGQTLGGGYIEYFRWINGLIEPEDIARNIFVESPMPHPTVVFRRGPYSQVGGYKDHRWPEDYDLWLRMHLAGFKFAKVPEVLVQWRDHPDRTSRCNPRYDVEAFFQAKAKYLAMGPLREVEEVVVWGAGKTSRGHAEYMTEYGVKIAAYIDIDPKKIGQKIRGIPVIAPEQLGEYANHLILPFVANRGARKEIRQALIKMGKVEGKDFICCA